MGDIKRNVDKFLKSDINETMDRSNKLNNNDYDMFMKEYAKKHVCCPKCGSTQHISTLVGYALDLDKKDEYKNLNICSCTSCEDEHSKHDRVPLTEVPTFEEWLKTFSRKEWYAEHLYLLDSGWVSISLMLDKYMKEVDHNL